MNLAERASSEWAFARGLLRVLRRTTPIAQHPRHTVGDLADGLAARFGDCIALESERESVTYRAWNARADRYARWSTRTRAARRWPIRRTSSAPPWPSWMRARWRGSTRRAPLLDHPVEVLAYGACGAHPRLDLLLDALPDAPPARRRRARGHLVRGLRW